MVRAEGRPSDPRTATFLVAEALSAIGTWATIIAIWAYAAYEFDASAGEVARFGLAFAVPGIVVGPFVGTLVDRIGPIKVLAVAKVIGVVASLALLLADDFTTLALLSAIHGVGGAFTIPALQSMPPRLVAGEHLARTNALVSLTDELAIVLGPVVGAGAIALFGFRGAFVVDALTFALGLVVLPLVRLRPVAASDVDGEVEAPPSFRAAFEGVRYVSRIPRARRVVLTVASVHTLYGVALLAEPLYVRDVLGRSPEVFASLQTVFGLTLVGGGLVVARAGERMSGFVWVAGGAAASGLAAMVYLGTSSLAVAYLGVVLWGAVTATISGPSRTVLQRSTPESHHGRVMATDFLASSTANVAGVVVAGVLVSVHGVSATVIGFGLAVCGAAALAWRAERRDVGPVADPEPAPVPLVP